MALAFLHSTSAGIVMLIFYIVYQQFENHVLQVSIMSRTVKVNPLTVLVSVLIGVELLGFLGALLAIPVAGVIQVVARDIYDERRMRWKDPITVGADEVPVPAKKAPAKKRAAATPASSTGTIASAVSTEAICSAHGDVIQMGRTTGTVVANGVEFGVAEVHRWTIEDGKAVHAHFSIDTPDRLEVLSRSA